MIREETARAVLFEAQNSGADYAELFLEDNESTRIEMIDGKVAKVKKVVKKPVEEYLKTQKRFRHLFKPVRQDAEIAAIQAIADRNFEKYGLEIKLKKE